MNAIGVVEISSIAKGIYVCDSMIKASNVTIIEALPMCPGKYVIIVGGGVADVKNAVEVGQDRAQGAITDSLVIPNIDPQVFKAINCSPNSERIGSLGIIETFSVSSGIRAADIAAKTSNISLIEIRLSRGMGGKSYIAMTGSVSDVDAAVNASVDILRNEGMLAGSSVIPSPANELKRFI